MAAVLVRVPCAQDHHYKTGSPLKGTSLVVVVSCT